MMQIVERFLGGTEKMTSQVDIFHGCVESSRVF